MRKPIVTCIAVVAAIMASLSLVGIVRAVGPGSSKPVKGSGGVKQGSILQAAPSGQIPTAKIKSLNNPSPGAKVLTAKIESLNNSSPGAKAPTAKIESSSPGVKPPRVIGPDDDPFEGPYDSIEIPYDPRDHEEMPRVLE